MRQAPFARAIAARVAGISLLATGCARPPPAVDSGWTDGDTDPETDSGSVGPDPAAVRVVTWNVESLSPSDSESYGAVRDVLRRIDADVVALNEIDLGDAGSLETLADELGYPTVVTPSTNPFGTLHNAVLTRLTAVGSTVWTSDALTGDPDANDLTRWPIAVEMATDAGNLVVVSQHWKSGAFDTDAFRRVVDGIRTAQAARMTATAAVLAVGDVNAELDDPPPDIPTFTVLPSDVPFGYVLGDDLAAALGGAGIPNDVFAPLTAAGLSAVDALQADGRDATRDSSGRRLDHVFADPSIAVAGALVYDARDEGLPTAVTLAGDPVAREATALASDHFPVVVDVLVP